MKERPAGDNAIQKFSLKNAKFVLNSLAARYVISDHVCNVTSIDITHRQGISDKFSLFLKTNLVLISSMVHYLNLDHNNAEVARYQGD